MLCISLEKVFEDVNFNFQVNRVLAFGDIACDRDEVYEACANITDFQTWYIEWRKIAETAEKEGRYLHSMYYYRMAEFMLIDDDPNKDKMYYKCTEMFDKAVPHADRHHVPYKGGYLPCIRIASGNSDKTVLVHGGYDSFIEEFYLLLDDFAQNGYNIILFEGEGQGETLRQGMKFNEQWENSVGAVLDYFELDEAALIGISWGGYFALRAAAFDKRIRHVVCFDVCYDGLDVMMGLLDEPARTLFKFMYQMKFKGIINYVVKQKMAKDNLANWGISHGMYITGTDTPYEFYQAIEKHSLKDMLGSVDQNVLLLAGEKDHYIPRWHFDHVKDNLVAANVTSRLFREAEGGEQHCRVGNYNLGLEYILAWLKENY